MKIFLCCFFSMFVVLVPSVHAKDQLLGRLPSEQTSQAIAGLDTAKRTSLSAKSPKKILVEPDKLDSKKKVKYGSNEQGKALVPLIIPNTMIIQFEDSGKRPT